MTEPMQLINSFTWFRGQPHQEAAIQWLDQHLSGELREEFGRRFRQKPEAKTLAQPPIIQLEMDWTEGFDSRGFRIFRLSLTNNGRAIDAINVLSGDLPSQSKNFIRPERDFSGSGRCLPEGVYSIGRVEDSQLIIAAPSWPSLADGIGRYWISLEVLPQYRANNRSAFGIHADFNASFAPGSIGCVCPFDADGLKKILKWMSAKARPVQLVCDLKTGFLKERGYRPPAEIVPQIVGQARVEKKPDDGKTNGQQDVITDLEQLAQRFGVDTSTIEVLLEILLQRLHSSSSGPEFGRGVESVENGIANNRVFSDAAEGVFLMSEPIKLLDAYRWFRGQSHQVDAVKWLDKHLPEDLREQFGRKFRTQRTDPQATALVQLELSWLGAYHTSGFRIFRLALTKEGKVLDKLPVLSGDVSTQKEPFVRPEKDNSGSLRCLPEGIYTIGRIQETALMRAVTAEPFSGSEEENSIEFDEFARYCIDLEILPQYKVNNRRTFGIHAHANAYYKPGSAGSICPFNRSDMRKILQWMESKDRPTELVCDLGTGFLKERSLLSLLPPDEKRALPMSNPGDMLESALKFTLKWEGGKVDHPDDPGGRTNRGITQRTYDNFRKLKELPWKDVFEATEQETKEIYREHYWKPSRANLMVLPLAIVHFDTAVLFGVGGAIEFLQDALGVKADGRFGTNTHTAFQDANNKKTALKIIEDRIVYHKQRVEQKPSQRVFLQGWINRAEDLKKFIANL